MREVKQGESCKLWDVVLYKRGTDQYVLHRIIKVYDDSAVAGVGYGTATLTLKSADGFCKYSWKCTVSDKGTTCWYTQSAGD